MPKVIGVRFRTSPRVYYFAPTEGEEYNKNTVVVVETQRGIELATVIRPPHDVPDEAIVPPLKGVMRIATENDKEAAKADDGKKREILSVAREKVAARGLDMKIVDCEFTVDHGKLVLYFTAEQRVDFRELVRDLASAFHTRIDLRQIGARDECKLIGSLGTCGMPCCCGRFESDSEHVSIKMAKNQNLALTPGKINGMCGRLLCCLGYENKTYEDAIRRLPKHGTTVTARDGRRGTVVSVTPLTEKVRVRIGDDDSFEFCEFDLEELSFTRETPPPDKNSNAKNNGDKKDKKERRHDGKTHGDKQERGERNLDQGKNGGGKNVEQDGGDGVAKPSGGAAPSHKRHKRGGKNNRQKQSEKGQPTARKPSENYDPTE